MSADPFVRLGAGVVYRGLESPHLFHVLRDELYELDEDGLSFLGELDGSRRKSQIQNHELLEYSQSEGLIEFGPEPAGSTIKRGQSPIPSLRYLEVILTLRCNLRCRHCYLGDAKSADLDPGLLSDLVYEFDEIQGLRLLLSGGEPLLYPDLDRLAALLPGRGFRSVLLTNGLGLDRSRLEELPIHEVQVSLDGLEAGHEALRGPGTFARALAAARVVAESGRDLSIATMIHGRNLEELSGLKELVQELGAREWSLEAPSTLGRWLEAGELLAPGEQAGAAISLGFGGSFHGSSQGFACGVHLAAVLPTGQLAPCGFYADEPLGDLAQDGLAKAWSRKKVKRLSQLDWCSDCPAGPECGGGCRYRAGGDGPDLVMCAAHGWPRGRPPQ